MMRQFYPSDRVEPYDITWMKEDPENEAELSRSPEKRVMERACTKTTEKGDAEQDNGEEVEEEEEIDQEQMDLDHESRGEDNGEEELSVEEEGSSDEDVDGEDL